MELSKKNGGKMSGTDGNDGTTCCFDHDMAVMDTSFLLNGPTHLL